MSLQLPGQLSWEGSKVEELPSIQSVADHHVAWKITAESRRVGRVDWEAGCESGLSQRAPQAEALPFGVEQRRVVCRRCNASRARLHSSLACGRRGSRPGMHAPLLQFARGRGGAVRERTRRVGGRLRTHARRRHIDLSFQRSGGGVEKHQFGLGRAGAQRGAKPLRRWPPRPSCSSWAAARCGCWASHRRPRWSPCPAAWTAPRRCGLRAGCGGG